MRTVGLIEKPKAEEKPMPTPKKAETVKVEAPKVQAESDKAEKE